MKINFILRWFSVQKRIVGGTLLNKLGIKPDLTSVLPTRRTNKKIKW